MNKNMSKLLKGCAAALIPLLALGACGGSQNGAAQSNGPVKVTFWHTATGNGAKALDSLIAEFNQANSGKITVDASYQGSYSDVQQKYTAAVQSKSTPSLLAMNDISTGFMMDSKQTVPVSNFTKGDSSFDASTIPDSVTKYYSDANGLVSMPFGVSQPMLYVNKSLAQQAGLDPANPPKTFDEIVTWAKAIKDKTGQYGFSMNMGDSWMLEELTASAGLPFCTPDNGRGSAPVSAVSLTDPKQLDVFGKVADMFKSGVGLNAGTQSKNMITAFADGKVGLVLTSTGSYPSMLPGGSADAVVLADFPKLDSNSKAGTPIGGQSLWISGPNHSEAEQKAAYELAKFLQTPHAQAVWTKATGYLFANTKAKDEAEGQESLKDPNVQNMYKQLESNAASNEALGCRTGAFPTVRKTVIGAFNDAVNGKDISSAMNDAQTKAASDIASYNKAAKK